MSPIVIEVGKQMNGATFRLTTKKSSSSLVRPDKVSMSKKQNLYVGRAGQMAVMAELLWRGAALAEIIRPESHFHVLVLCRGLARS